MYLHTLALATVLAGATHAQGQPVVPDTSVPAAAVQTATPTVASQLAAIGSFAAIDITKQTAWLGSQISIGAFAGWSDEDVLAMAHTMKPEALMHWLKAEVARLLEYEYRMRHQERVKNQWQSQATLMSVRYRSAPRQVCTRWLKGGAHTDQEIIYDEAVHKNEVYGHLGRLVDSVAIQNALDDSLARSQSNHTTRELGLQLTVNTVERGERAHVAAGGSGKFNEIKVVTEDGERMLRLT